MTTNRAATPLERRHANTRATMQKFGAKTFKWGGCDCAKLAAFHLRRFGHTPPQTGGYRSLRTAKARIAALGFETMPDLIASLLPEIPPASALMGDVVSFACADALGGIGIVIGNGNMMCFHENYQTPVIMTMGAIDIAWRVP